MPNTLSHIFFLDYIYIISFDNLFSGSSSRGCYTLAVLYSSERERGAKRQMPTNTDSVGFFTMKEWSSKETAPAGERE